MNQILNKILNKIKSLSYALAFKIYDKDDAEDDIEFWKYHVYKYINAFFYLLTGLIIAIIFGYWKQFLIVAFTFGYIRKKIGGYHSETPNGCFINTEIMLIVGSALAILTSKYIIPMFLISILSAFFITPYIPRMGCGSVQRSEKKNLYFRKVYRTRFLVVYVLNIVLIYLTYNSKYNLSIYSSSLSSAVLMVAAIMTDTGEKCLNWISNKFGLNKSE